jgi:hypothetical protein
VRATPLTVTGPKKLTSAAGHDEPVPHTKWTNRRGPVIRALFGEKYDQAILEMLGRLSGG